MSDFRCSVCGGILEIEDRSLGLVKCLNCGNRFTMDLKSINIEEEKPKKENPQILLNENLEEFQKKNQPKGVKMISLTCKTFITLLALALIGVVCYITYNMLTNLKNISIVEWLIIVSIVVVYDIFAIFSQKIDAKSSVGGFVILFVFFVMVGLFIFLIYTAYVRYIII